VSCDAKRQIHPAESSLIFLLAWQVERKDENHLVALFACDACH
jgi:hypothetical protein